MRTHVPVTFLDLIEFQSFASLWYWLLVGLVWTRRMSVTLGAPAPLLRHASRGHAEARRDLETLVGMELQSHRSVSPANRLFAVAFWSFAISALLVLGLGYGIEFAQAVTLLVVPLTLVWWLEERVLRRLEQVETAEELCKVMSRLRLRVQIVGFGSVFVAAIWGMYYTLSHFTL